jgi:fructose-1,6-bisphosphatase I
MTIERFIIDQERKFPSASGSLSNLLYDLALAAKIIARETSRAGLISDILGEVGESINPTGDRQYNLDVFADDVIFKMNDHTGRLCVMASEEHEDILPIPQQFNCGSYVLVFDPLDGSGNIDVNGSVGTIFSIFRKVSAGDRGTLEDCLQPGRDLVAAGYIVYGSSTIMVYSTGEGVHGFTLDPSVGEFLLSHRDIRIPDHPAYYSTNYSYAPYWTTGVKKYVDWLGDPDHTDIPKLSMRYNGALVSDFHRNLLKGGVYVYPGDTRNPKRPEGKLRLLYENAPLAFLAKQAGGYASDGVGDILEIAPSKLHQRTPLFIGNRYLVERAEALIREHDQEWLELYLPLREGRA